VKKIPLTKESLKTFLQVLNYLSKTNKDVSIENGHIRQRSNTIHSVFDIDCTSVLGDANIKMTNIGSKEKLLTIFKKQMVDVDIYIDKDEYIFTDGTSALSFKKPYKVINDFITETELDEIINPTQCIRVSKYSVSKQLLERINNWSIGLESEYLKVVFEKDKISVKLEMKEKVQSVVGTLLTINTLDYNELKGDCSFPIAPFNIDTNNFDMEFWYNAEKEILFIKLGTNIGVTNIIPISVWAGVKLERP
jgi:hypothetical protein